MSDDNPEPTPDPILASIHNPALRELLANIRKESQREPLPLRELLAHHAANQTKENDQC